MKTFALLGLALADDVTEYGKDIGKICKFLRNSRNSRIYGVLDSKCIAKGGQCLNWDYYKCTAGWETGICSGAANIKFWF